MKPEKIRLIYGNWEPGSPESLNLVIEHLKTHRERLEHFESKSRRATKEDTLELHQTSYGIAVLQHVSEELETTSKK